MLIYVIFFFLIFFIFVLSWSISFFRDIILSAYGRRDIFYIKNQAYLGFPHLCYEAIKEWQICHGKEAELRMRTADLLV